MVGHASIKRVPGIGSLGQFWKRGEKSGAMRAERPSAALLTTRQIKEIPILSDQAHIPTFQYANTPSPMNAACTRNTMFTALRYLVAAMAFSNRAVAAEIYRCSVDGGTVLTDAPCVGKTAAIAPPRVETTSAGVLLSQGAHRFHGNWYGPLQLQAKVGETRVAGAHALVQSSFTVDENGSVRGSAPDAGCQFRGIASWDALLHTYALEVSATGCKVAELNRRYNGQLLMPGSGVSATLALSAGGNAGLPAREIVAEVRATLHR